MIKLREKDENDINLIHERYLVLENMIELEKNDLINENRELINKIQIYEKNFSNSEIILNDESINNLKRENKNINDENKLLQFKIKEQESTIIEFEKLNEEMKIIKNENLNLKNSLNENNNNYQGIIKDLNNKINLINNELLQMKNNEILLNSKKNISKEEITLAFDNKIKSQDIEILKKEIEDLKKIIKDTNDPINYLASKIQSVYSSKSLNSKGDLSKKSC